MMSSGLLHLYMLGFSGKIMPAWGDLQDKVEAFLALPLGRGFCFEILLATCSTLLPTSRHVYSSPFLPSFLPTTSTPRRGMDML